MSRCDEVDSPLDLCDLDWREGGRSDGRDRGRGSVQPVRDELLRVVLANGCLMSARVRWLRRMEPSSESSECGNESGSRGVLSSPLVDMVSRGVYWCVDRS